MKIILGLVVAILLCAVGHTQQVESNFEWNGHKFNVLSYSHDPRCDCMGKVNWEDNYFLLPYYDEGIHYYYMPKKWPETVEEHILWYDMNQEVQSYKGHLYVYYGLEHSPDCACHIK
jgi:hypothetical protein